MPDGAEVVLVTFTDARRARAYGDEHRLGYPVLRDPDRAAYRAFGLRTGTVRRVWGWATLRRYVEIIREEGLRGLRRPTEDTLQLGGDFVVAPDGTLAWGYWSIGPADRPAVGAVIGAAHDAAG
jgi:hypothetical protein